MNDQSAKEILDIIVDMLAKIEERAEQYPQENSSEIIVSVFLEDLLARVPGHLEPVVRAAIARFVEVAPPHVFVPYWLREQRL